MDAPKTIKLSDIPEAERTPLVVQLLEIIAYQQEQIQALKDEIAELKGHKKRPKIRPSHLGKNPHSKNDDGKRGGSAKRNKTIALVIHETVVVNAVDVPEGSRFKGYQDYTVQDLVIKPHNTRYRLARWQTPDGAFVVAELPPGVIAGHFGPTLVSFILHQYYQAHVTQPLVLEQISNFGVDISAGQVNTIITDDKDAFHIEKNEILRAGLDVSPYVNVDDTGARHNGRNGYCTHIGSAHFAWFESTDSKSRINFLEILRGGTLDYVLNTDAFAYMQRQSIPKTQMRILALLTKRHFENEASWLAALTECAIVSTRHIRIATEGALLGSLVSHGINPNLVIVSDDAGQFDVLLHALCWVHSERAIHKLVGFTEPQRQAVVDMRTKLWEFYARLKSYKEAPTAQQKDELDNHFDAIFLAKTCYVSLNLALKRIHKNKEELLLVLERPEIPLHNNASESDIREYVKRRKVSGSTRSILGRRCRDTFTSLKKTCRKLGVSFWEYLNDRVGGESRIAFLPDLIRLAAKPTPVLGFSV